MKIVFDSSVWIAGIGSQKGFASESIYKCYANVEIEIFISSAILDEVTNNLEKKLKFSQDLAQKSRKIIRGLCDLELQINFLDEKTIKLTVSKDRHVLALCRKSQADYLITFDRKHLLHLERFGKTKILEPKDFVKLLEAEDL